MPLRQETLSHDGDSQFFYPFSVPAIQFLHAVARLLSKGRRLGKRGSSAAQRRPTGRSLAASATAGRCAERRTPRSHDLVPRPFRRTPEPRRHGRFGLQNRLLQRERDQFLGAAALRQNADKLAFKPEEGDLRTSEQRIAARIALCRNNTEKRTCVAGCQMLFWWRIGGCL